MECDGATYHRSAAARDRDKTRQQVLENLGWNVLRVWSVDWWYDSQAAIDRVHSALRKLLDDERTWALQEEKVERSDVVEVIDADHNFDDREEIQPQAVTTTVEDVPSLDQAREPLIARQVPVHDARRYYTRAELPDATHEQDRFFEEDYSAQLRAIALSILETEAPIREDVLARQVARTHGFSRTGAKLRQRILDLVGDAVATEETTGRFLWNADGPLSTVPFRYADNEEERRSVDEISISELLGLIQASPHFLGEADPAIAYARELGLARLAQSARERLEEAISRAKLANDMGDSVGLSTS